MKYEAGHSAVMEGKRYPIHNRFDSSWRWYNGVAVFLIPRQRQYCSVAVASSPRVVGLNPGYIWFAQVQQQGWMSFVVRGHAPVVTVEVRGYSIRDRFDSCWHWYDGVAVFLIFYGGGGGMCGSQC